MLYVKLDSVQGIENYDYGQAGRNQSNSSVLILFIFTYFLKIVVEKNQNSNIDTDYKMLPLKDFEDLLVDVALDSLLCSLYFLNIGYGTFIRLAGIPTLLH